MNRSAEIAARVAEVRGRIAMAARRAGRPEDAVTLVAVTKTRPVEDLLRAFEAGIRHFGENRVQEAEAKFPSLPAGSTRHLIGPVQSNKAARAAIVADVIQTVDRPDVASRLDRAAAAKGKTLAVYLEVHLGSEPTKSGVEPERLAELAAAVRTLPALALEGVMAIPPHGAARPYFRQLRRLAEENGLHGVSMGMSDDFEEAVEEGATIVRIGSALFGLRS